MPLRHLFKNFTIQMLGKLDCSLGSAAWTHSPFLARKCHQQRVFAGIAINPGCPVRQYPAVKILFQSCIHFISQNPVLRLKAFFPRYFKCFVPVIHHLIQCARLRRSALIVLKFIFCSLPPVFTNHLDLFGERLQIVPYLYGIYTELPTTRLSKLQ